MCFEASQVESPSRHLAGTPVIFSLEPSSLAGRRGQEEAPRPLGCSPPPGAGLEVNSEGLAPFHSPCWCSVPG